MTITLISWLCDTYIPVLLLWLIFTSFAKEVLFSVTLACSSVCMQHHLKSYKRIVMKFHGWVQNGKRKKLISDFYMDEALRWPLCHWLFQNIVHLQYTLHVYSFFFFFFFFFFAFLHTDRIKQREVTTRSFDIYARKKIIIMSPLWHLHSHWIIQSCYSKDIIPIMLQQSSLLKAWVKGNTQLTDLE